jgi:predicted DNA-binding transcriptional regulator AlpA
MADTTAADVLISAKEVLARFNPPPTVRTLDRWIADPRVGFPNPIRIGGKRRFFIEREVTDFIRRKADARTTNH